MSELELARELQIEKGIEDFKKRSPIPKQKFPNVSGLSKKIAKEMTSTDCFDLDVSISKTRRVSICVAGGELEEFRAYDWIALAVSPTDAMTEILANENIFDYLIDLLNAVKQRFKKNKEVTVTLTVNDEWGENLVHVCNDFLQEDYESDGRLRSGFNEQSDGGDWELFSLLSAKLSERIRQEKTIGSFQQ